mmetsp:Transcript_62261/g.126812  ORF Transcript_62261/g.126812 Transcript_62261/m.126812 type:complete len:138 (-) Transcript_62261:4394-4807(-)
MKHNKATNTNIEDTSTSRKSVYQGKTKTIDDDYVSRNVTKHALHVRLRSHSTHRHGTFWYPKTHHVKAFEDNNKNHQRKSYESSHKTKLAKTKTANKQFQKHEHFQNEFLSCRRHSSCHRHFRLGLRKQATRTYLRP